MLCAGVGFGGIGEDERERKHLQELGRVPASQVAPSSQPQQQATAYFSQRAAIALVLRNFPAGSGAPSPHAPHVTPSPTHRPIYVYIFFKNDLLSTKTQRPPAWSC